MLEATPRTCRVDLRAPPSASSWRAHAEIGGSGRWLGWGRYPGAFRERGCNLRPARQRKDGAHRDTDGGRNQQHSYSAHYYLYPTDGGFRFGSLTTSRSIQMLNNQLSGLYSNDQTTAGRRSVHESSQTGGRRPMFLDKQGQSLGAVTARCFASVATQWPFSGVRRGGLDDRRVILRGALLVPIDRWDLPEIRN